VYCATRNIRKFFFGEVEGGGDRRREEDFAAEVGFHFTRLRAGCAPPRSWGPEGEKGAKREPGEGKCVRWVKSRWGGQGSNARREHARQAQRG